jgi:carboxylate-amine ligase
MPERGRCVPVRRLAAEALDACAPHAAALGCEEQLAGIETLLDSPPASRQRELAGEDEELEGLVEHLAGRFLHV